MDEWSPVMSHRGRLRRVRRATGCTVAAAALLLALPADGLGRPGDQVRPRSLHLAFSATAIRGYGVSVETVGHHRVVLNVQKKGEFASYTVRGKVNRRRVFADFGRFGQVSLRFHGQPQPFALADNRREGKPRKHLRCKGRRPEREVGRFHGTLIFDGQREFTRLAVGKVHGEVRRTYRQVCRPLRKRAQASVSRRASADPFGFNLAVLTAHSRVGDALTSFSAISLQSPLGIRLPGQDLSSIVTASRRERVGRVRVFRSVFQVAAPGSIRISRRGVEPQVAHVALDSPFEGNARYKSRTDSSPASWTGSLSVRLLGTGPLPLTGPTFKARLCRAGAFNPTSPCFQRAEASVAALSGPSRAELAAEVALGAR
jgi:hypothetical protein